MEGSAKLLEPRLLGGDIKGTSGIFMQLFLELLIVRLREPNEAKIHDRVTLRRQLSPRKISENISYTTARRSA